MTMVIPALAEVVEARVRRLRERLAASGYDAVVCCGGENVQYATGYRSAPGSHRRSQRMAALVTASEAILVGPTSEAASSVAAGVDPDHYVSYGAFYVDSADADHPATRCARPRDSFGAAVEHAAGLLRRCPVVGVDEADCADEVRAALASALPGARFEPASGWLQRVRSVKLPGEVDRLRHAARLAEDGITAAVESAAPGVSERELAAAVARVMAEGGAMPRSITATVGVRSALADEFPNGAQARAGDLLRFDVSCEFDGYRSDIGRTAVLGEPDAPQVRRYHAIRCGEQREIDICRPGLPAAELFAEAVRAVEEAGLRPYRRNHCGHGIGMQIYEGFRVAPDDDHVLEEGNVLCVETPYYVLGWGGMMVEDTLVVTAGGAELLTTSTRELRTAA